MANGKERPPGFWVYTTLLGLISLLLTVVGSLSISRFDGFEKTVAALAESSEATAREVASMRSTIDAWAKQNFVARDLFDAMRAEFERRIAAVEKK